MLVNACLIDENLPITHLATALHSHKHKDLKMEAPLTKEQILDNKINVYEQVAKASAVVIEKLMASKVCLHFSVYLLFYVKLIKENFSLTCRIKKSKMSTKLNTMKIMSK